MNRSFSERQAVPLVLLVLAAGCPVRKGGDGGDTGPADAGGEGPRARAGSSVTAWAARLRGELGGTVVDRVVERDGTVGACDRFCLKAGALLQHVQWPDGVADRSGVDHEPDMLAFLRDHPLR